MPEIGLTQKVCGSMVWCGGVVVWRGGVVWCGGWCINLFYCPAQLKLNNTDVDNALHSMSQHLFTNIFSPVERLYREKHSHNIQF